MIRRIPLALSLGLAIGCDVPEKPDVALTTGALTRLTDYQQLTGTDTVLVDAFVFSESMFFRTNYMLDEDLDPLSGIGPNGPSILGSSLGGVRVDGQALAGRAVIGTELQSLSELGGTETIRIDDVRPSDNGDGDLLHYDVSVHRNGGWEPLCGGQPAIALPGSWDLSRGTKGAAGWEDRPGFFFACQGSTVEKCYELGFKPWKFQRQDETVLTLHEACVRALRADYGGTGETGTSDGVQVVLSTEREPLLPEGFELEAAWSVDGARCRLRERVAGLSPDYQQVPVCDEERLNDGGNLLYTFTRAAEVDPDLRLAVGCDEGSGDVVSDAVEGRVGTSRGSAGWTSDTPDGSASACDFGNDDGITLESPQIAGQELTMLAWVKVDSFASRDDPRIISKASGTAVSEHDWMLSFKDGALRSRIKTDTVTETLTRQRITLGNWHHVAATYDGSSIRLYIDGVLDTVVPKHGQLALRPFQVGIGNQPEGAGDKGLDGQIDGARVYSRALTAAEIANQVATEGVNLGGGRPEETCEPGTDCDLRLALLCDEGSGDLTSDAAGGRAGTLTGNASWSADTPDGSPSACEFNGDGDRITLPSLNIYGDQLTMLAWVKVDSFADRDDPRVISKALNESHDAHDWMLGFKHGGSLRARIKTYSVTEVLTDAKVSLGQWHHVAVTYDGTSIRMYIDGVLDKAVAKSGNLALGPDNVGIGNQPEGSGDKGLDGRLDGVRVYSRALSPTEIASQVVDERSGHGG